MPNGGAALGPRHLAPTLPFLAAIAALGFERMPGIGFVTGFYSFLITGIATLIDAMPPVGLANPLLERYLPRLIDTHFTNMIPYSLGVTPELSAAIISTLMIAVYLAVFLLTHTSRRGPEQGPNTTAPEPKLPLID